MRIQSEDYEDNIAAAGMIPNFLESLRIETPYLAACSSPLLQDSNLLPALDLDALVCVKLSPDTTLSLWL